MERRYRCEQILLVACYLASLSNALAAAERPGWVISNGFHSSIALRTRDVPFWRELTDDSRADIVVIGWGAAEFYRGRTNAWTLLQAIVSSGSILHIVPVRGPVAARFAHSDVIRLSLPEPNFQMLLRQLDRTFATDARGRKILLGPGYSGRSRFYAGRERFYFPNMCNVWVAAKLRRSGMAICVPCALMAPGLVHQLARCGEPQQRRRKPADAF